MKQPVSEKLDFRFSHSLSAASGLCRADCHQRGRQSAAPGPQDFVSGHLPAAGRCVLLPLRTCSVEAPGRIAHPLELVAAACCTSRGVAVKMARRTGCQSQFSKLHLTAESPGARGAHCTLSARCDTVAACNLVRVPPMRQAVTTLNLVRRARSLYRRGLQMTPSSPGPTPTWAQTWR